MTIRFDLYRRLEPARPLEDLDRGFLAEVSDPLWLLGRQWQLGEHQGEDASSPAKVLFYAHADPIDTQDDNPDTDPRLVPPEAIVESEPDDWWTAGRRIRLGVLAGATLPPIDEGPVPEAFQPLLLADLPAPYDRFNGRGYDGQKLYAAGPTLGLDPFLFTAVPKTQPQDLWDPVELIYRANFTCAERTLTLDRHSGGHIDWYSVDADAALPFPVPVSSDLKDCYPDRLRYPGAPHPRWWQIEDAKVDIGGFPPDRSHFATMLLIDLIASHSDDWFLFPIETESGTAVTPYTLDPQTFGLTYGVTIRDSFGEHWLVAPPDTPPDGSPGEDWSLFKVAGLPTATMLVWPTVATPIAGPVLEDVVLGVDEDANLLFAVERRLRGRDVPTPRREEPGSETMDPPVLNGRKTYRYSPSTPVFPNWHPYEIHDRTVDGIVRRRFIQGRLANLDRDPPTLMPPPLAAVLCDPTATPDAIPLEPAHQIEPATVPSQGMRLERRYMLARRTDGQPVLWIQRRRSPLLAPPASHLRFDVFVEETPGGHLSRHSESWRLDVQ